MSSTNSPASRVLYVEDDESNIRLVQRVLQLRPAVLLILARTGHDAVDAARREVPDLILLDRHLPDMHGDDVLVLLRSTPATGTIPVVMVSGDSGRHARAADDLVGYLDKPFDIDQLLAVIDGHERTTSEQ